VNAGPAALAGAGGRRAAVRQKAKGRLASRRAGSGCSSRYRNPRNERKKWTINLKRGSAPSCFGCAIAGEFLTYDDFFHRIDPGKRMGNFPHQEHLRGT
jgi:hypothetical protein